MDEADVDGELGGEGAGGELGQGQPVLVLGRGDPGPVLHQVLLHVAGQGDGSAEADGAQPEEVHDQLYKGIGRRRLWDVTGRLLLGLSHSGCLPQEK